VSDKHSHDRHKWHRVLSLHPERDWSVGIKLLMLTIPLLTAVVVVAMWAVQMRTSANLQEKIVQRARSLHTQIMADRQYYASAIVPRVEALGGSLGEDYRQVHGRFPLPATFVREVSEITAKIHGGYTANLISPWAINPDKGVKDQFQRDAFAYLMEHPTGQFMASDTVEGRAVMRILMGDRAAAQSCVSCHNAHPKSPRHNFKLNDLMGGLEIAIPVDQYLNESRQDLVLTLAGGAGLCLMMAGIVVLGTRWTVSRPLARLTTKVQAVTGSGERRVAQADAVPSGNEVVRLEKTFENMVEVIKGEERRFHRVVEAAPNAILLVNQTGTITLVNAQTERLFGYAREELLGQPIELLVPARFRGAHPGHRTAFFAAPTTRVMGAGRDLYGLHKDGREIPIEIGLNPIETEEGMLVLASIVDITARKQAEEERDRFFTLSLDMMCIAKSDGYFKRVSPAFTQTLGWSTEEMLARPFLDFVHPDDRSASLREVEKLVVRGEKVLQFENRFRHKDGSWRTLSWKSVPQPGGIMYGTARDVTEQKKAVEAQRRLAAIVESTDDAIIGKTLDSIVTSWNKGAERLYGYTAKEVIGKPVTILLPPDHWEEEARIIACLKRGESVDHLETVRQAKNGRLIDVSLTISPIKDERGTIVGVSTIVRDITHQKKMEEEIVRAKDDADRANQAKSEFLSRMSHELRTPLNAVLGFSQLLELDPLSPEQQQYVRHILNGGRHLLTLINEVLDVARIEAGRMTLSLEPVSTSAAIGDAVDLVRPQAAARNIQLVLPSAQEQPVYVRADRQRLKQVFLNLLSNGVKYNREGGTLTVSCQLVPEGRYRIMITDTGGGIPPALLSRLFTPFDRLEADSRTEGTGLGLVLSRSLVTAMGGTVSVDSVVGRGTSVSVDLLLSEPPTTRAAAISDKVQVTAPVSGGAFTILYIEDNMSNYQLIERLVKRRPGIRLFSAMQGKLGVEIAASHHPDLILLDLNLPDIPGDEVLLRLRENPNTVGIPVIMLSADAMQKQIDKLLAAGARGYLTKPIEVAQFYALLDEFMAKKGE